MTTSFRHKADGDTAGMTAPTMAQTGRSSRTNGSTEPVDVIGVTGPGLGLCRLA